MQVTVQWMGQLRSVRGAAAETVVLRAGATVGELLPRLADTDNSRLRALLLTADGRPQPTVLVFVNDEQALPDRALGDGDTITLLTPIAGGRA
jgi:molybdopterin converting factor small subunit